jgi:glycosyltransferase involved in cell wall biosynthesis
MPFFSIIIPTRNEEKRLVYCLPSLLNQSFQDFEIIIVEDPETDDKTSEFIQKLNSDKIKYIFHPKGLIIGAKRDFAVDSVDGKFIYFIDADMEFPENTLQEIHDLIVANSSKIVFVAEETPGKTWLNKMKNIEKTLAISNLSLSAARVFETDLYRSIGGYNKNLIAAEDGDLSDRAMKTGSKYSVTHTKIKHYETVGVNYWNHLVKKFKYGISSKDYFNHQKSLNGASDSVPKSTPRSTSSLQTYFFSPILWKHPATAIQFVVFKFIELSVLAFGLIYGKIFSKRIVNTR